MIEHISLYTTQCVIMIINRVRTKINFSNTSVETSNMLLYTSYE